MSSNFWIFAEPFFTLTCLISSFMLTDSAFNAAHKTPDEYSTQLFYKGIENDFDSTVCRIEPTTERIKTVG
jgi:hypothetical protein